MPQHLTTAARVLTGSGVKLCSEKTLDMPFLAYHGCSKLLKVRAVFHWGTHTCFTVSVGIDPSLTKTRRTRSADCICMDKRARISPLWDIIRICASYTCQYVKRIILLRNIPRMREQWCPGRFFPPPQKNGLGTRLVQCGALVCVYIASVHAGVKIA